MAIGCFPKKAIVGGMLGRSGLTSSCMVRGILSMAELRLSVWRSQRMVFDPERARPQDLVSAVSPNPYMTIG